MQIGSISSVAAIDAVSPVSPIPRASGSGSGKAGTPEASSAGSATGSSPLVSGDTTGGTTSGVTGPQTTPTSSTHAASQTQSSLGAIAQTLDVVYSTKVAGHNYLGSVQQAAGEYIASAVRPPDAPINAVGTSIQAAENNLTFVIDEMA
ncbi:MAG TPA: hypothetical protein VNW54_15345 [Granulicella sp.]|nr:hypothetical protein [Granulicella sp.]